MLQPRLLLVWMRFSFLVRLITKVNPAVLQLLVAAKSAARSWLWSVEKDLQILANHDKLEDKCKDGLGKWCDFISHDPKRASKDVCEALNSEIVVESLVT